MKTYQIVGVGCVAGFALAVGQASANLVVNGSFESGVSGFSSGYGNVTGIAGGLATGGDVINGSGEGLFAVDDNAQFYHSAFTTAAAQDGSQMMIVNGSSIPGKNVWSGTLSPGMSAGVTYLFSAWVMNVYHDNVNADASLQFSIGGNPLGAITPTGTGIWKQFSALYTPSTSGQLPTSVDLAVNWYANDFAIDNISITAVPEPTTMLAGALLLLPFGASTIRGLRRKA